MYKYQSILRTDYAVPLLHNRAPNVYLASLYPLTWLFNQPQSGSANPISVHKSGSKNIASTYRGIPLLSVLSKKLDEYVFRIIYNRSNPVLNSLQHGFPPRDKELASDPIDLV